MFSANTLPFADALSLLSDCSFDKSIEGHHENFYSTWSKVKNDSRKKVFSKDIPCMPALFKEQSPHFGSYLVQNQGSSMDQSRTRALGPSIVSWE